MKKRQRERGSAMVVTLILITALLAGGGVLVSLQMTSTKSSDLTRTNMSAIFCAEAGLAAARPIVAQNYGAWKTNLCATYRTNPSACTEPAWLSTAINAWGTHDIDGDGKADFELYIHDNDDELPTTNLSVDNDLRVFVVARCIKYPDTVKQVEELVEHNGAFGCIGNMIGGADGDGNSNGGC
jgi:hypothetical protein